MKKYIQYTLIILVVFILGIFISGSYKDWFGSKGIDVSNIATTKVKKGNFEIVISEVGQLDAKKSTNVSSNTEGKIVKLVPEGFQVKKGDPIIWLDTSELEKQINDAENNVKNSEQDLLKAEEQYRLQVYQNDMSVESQKLALENSNLDYSDATIKLAKTQRLFDAQITPESNLEDAKLRVLSAKTQVEKSELSLAQAEETRKSNLVSGQIQVAQSKAALKEAQRKLNELKDRLHDAVISAPGDGIIVYEQVWRGGDRSKVQEGDQVWQRMNIAQIPDLSIMVSIIMIDEIDISRIKIGQEVRVKVDAIPNIELKGRVSKIAPLAVDKGAGDAPWWMRQEASGVKAFEILAEIDTNQYELRPGMTTKTDIIIEKFRDVIYVPREAVFDKGGKSIVYALQSKTANEYPVTLGKGDGNFVIIKKGLNGNETICLRDPTKQLKESTSEKQIKSSESPATPSVPQLPSQ